jgi:hypothetical protein
MTGDQITRIRFPELSPLDALELRQSLPRGSYTVEREVLNAHERGDLGIAEAVVVVVSLQALQAIAAWLLKTTKRQTVVITTETIKPDGTIERGRLEIGRVDSEAPKEGVLRQLLSALKLDPSIASNLLRPGGGTG